MSGVRAISRDPERNKSQPAWENAHEHARPGNKQAMAPKKNKVPCTSAIKHDNACVAFSKEPVVEVNAEDTNVSQK